MMQTIAAILRNKGHVVHTVLPDETISKAVARMAERGIGSLLVVDGESSMIGILTERDVLVRVVAPGHDPTHVTVREIMTADLVTVTPTASIETAMEVMSRTCLRHLPVVEGCDVCGLVSVGDITRRLVEDREAQIGDLIFYITHG